MAMGILRYFGLQARSESDTTATPPAVMPPSRTDVTDVRQASTLDAVFRSLAYLQTVTGQLTMDAWRAGLPIISSLVDHPDIQHSQREWIIDNVASLSSTGNAFWSVLRDAQGQVANIEVLDPRIVGVYQDERGKCHYQVRGRDVAPGTIKHLRYLTLPGEALGLGPIQAGRRGLSGMLAVADYSDNLFREGGIPAGILTTDGNITPTQAEDAEKRWMDKQRTGKVTVLGHGLSFKTTAVSPQDLQWLESQKFSVTKIARLFGIPPIKLAIAIEGGSMTYQNIEQAALDAMRDTLMGYLSPIEYALTWLLPRGQHARFNLDGVQRPDTKTRYEAHEIGIRAKFLTVEEVRRIEGLPPMPTSSETTPAPSDAEPENTPA